VRLVHPGRTCTRTSRFRVLRAVPAYNHRGSNQAVPCLTLRMTPNRKVQWWHWHAYGCRQGVWGGVRPCSSHSAGTGVGRRSAAALEIQTVAGQCTPARGNAVVWGTDNGANVMEQGGIMGSGGNARTIVPPVSSSHGMSPWLRFIIMEGSGGRQAGREGRLQHSNWVGGKKMPV